MIDQHLQNPTRDELQKSYRQLQRFESLSLQCENDSLSQTLNNLESVGYIGFKIHLPNLQNQSTNIQVTKGKHGPCFDTGQQANYTGQALAALDDDAHLLFREKDLPICQKTAQIYQSDFYKNYTHVSSEDPEMVEKLDSTPIVFDCDDYEDSIQYLLSICPDPVTEEETECVFYTGPFKALISNSGYLIRRGEYCRIPKKDALSLKEEGCSIAHHNYPSYHHFKHLIQSDGSKALLNIEFRQSEITVPLIYSSEIFEKLSEHFTDKLSHCIEKNLDYIMVVGSDPEDKLGCCPSEDVGYANQLMRSGILVKAQQSFDKDQCPIQLYAFRDELEQKDGELSFKKNHELRQRVKDSLKPSISHKILKWILFTFILLSLILAFKKFSERRREVEQKQVQHLIEDHQLNKTTFVLFHEEVRCEMCLVMEEYTREYSQSQQLNFLNINMNLAHWKSAIDEHQLFSAALFIIHPDKKQGEQVTLIREAWETWKDPEAFKVILKKYQP